MKKYFLAVAVALLAVSCTKRTPISGQQFKATCEQLGYTAEQRVGKNDTQNGILSKHFIVDTAGSLVEIMFFEFAGDEPAKEAFQAIRAETQQKLRNSIEHGSPNDSGAFGNTQEFFALVMPSEYVNLIRVANTLAYSHTTTIESMKMADQIFEQIGYKDKRNKEANE